MKPLLEFEKQIKEAATAKGKSMVPAIELAIDSAIVAGHDTEDLVSLCIRNGYNEGYVRSTISKILVQRRVRRKTPVGGRRRGNEAVALFAHAIKTYDQQWNSAQPPDNPRLVQIVR